MSDERETRQRRRMRAVMVSRAFKELFMSPVERRPRRIWRRLFLGDGDQLRRSGEAALADLREFTGAQRTHFDRDPLVMARRAGRRDVWLRIINYLNLDEAQVQQLMEIDDGIE